MKVKELIEALSILDQDAQVILQKDAEGNGFSPLSGCDSHAIFVPYEKAPWFGEVKSTIWSAEEACMEEGEWEEFLKKPRCVVLFPVN